MRRKALAALAVVAGIGVAALSATAMWPDGAATAGSGTPSATPSSGPTDTLRETRALERAEQAKASAAPVKAGVPELLQLPSLRVSAPVSRIGVAGSQGLTPPPDYTTVGWWQQGVRPGAPAGTAIIAGHTVHTGGGALDDLEDMRVGDPVVLSQSRGKLAYTVSSVRTYSKGRLASKAAKIFAQDGPGRLAVVTCEDWNGTIYLSNVVVMATSPRLVDSNRSR